MNDKQKFGNIKHVQKNSEQNIDKSKNLELMHQFLTKRDNKHISFGSKKDLVEFVDCSYLGLDTHPALKEGACNLIQEWGTHIGCVRTRFSIEPQHQLEAELGDLFGGHAITFASVSTTHMSVIPLLANGMLLGENVERPLLVFDKFAHSSMQYLKPIAAQDADIATIDNNDLNQLEDHLKAAKLKGQTTVYLTDSVFSMGGLPPLDELHELTQKYDLYLYLDDAHGTSVFGDKGEGYVIEKYGHLPERVILVFSLAKAFGCNGGGVAFPKAIQKKLTSYYGQIYAFSSALPWGMIGASLSSLELHRNGTVKSLQQDLKSNIRIFCKAMDIPMKPYMSPVQGVHIGDADTAMSIAVRLMEEGYYAPCMFFPVVAKNNARIRICISAKHSAEDLEGFAKAIKTAVHDHQRELVTI